MPHIRIHMHVGVEYFGPFEVKRACNMEKWYGVLFTCFALNVVHIEVAHSLDNLLCINAIRRFICRRGQVSTLRSDSGTNFIGTKRELREALKEIDHSKIITVMTCVHVKDGEKSNIWPTCFGQDGHGNISHCYKSNRYGKLTNGTLSQETLCWLVQPHGMPGWQEESGRPSRTQELCDKYKFKPTQVC